MAARARLQHCQMDTHRREPLLTIALITTVATVWTAGFMLALGLCKAAAAGMADAPEEALDKAA